MKRSSVLSLLCRNEEPTAQLKNGQLRASFSKQRDTTSFQNTSDTASIQKPSTSWNLLTTKEKNCCKKLEKSKIAELDALKCTFQSPNFCKNLQGGTKRFHFKLTVEVVVVLFIYNLKYKYFCKDTSNRLI